jgi:K+ transporter
MKTNQDLITQTPNRSLEIASLYHKQSLELINLALMHNKIAIEASHQRAVELMHVKDTSRVHELVSTHMVHQIKDYLNFAVAAYQLGFDAHSQVTGILQKQIEDNRALTEHVLSSPALTGNPISALAMLAVKSAMDTSHAVLSGAKVAAEKTAELAKQSLSSLQK